MRSTHKAVVGVVSGRICLALVATTTLVACASPAVGREAVMVQPSSQALQVVYSDWLARERTVERRETARLAVVVRSAERPLAPAGFSDVTVTSLSNGVVRRLSPDSNGTALLDSLPAGSYRVRARRIGHLIGTVEIELSKGCRADLEIYLGLDVVGIDPPAPTPNRFIMTTCTPRVAK